MLTKHVCVKKYLITEGDAFYADDLDKLRYCKHESRHCTAICWDLAFSFLCVYNGFKSPVLKKYNNNFFFVLDSEIKKSFKDWYLYFLFNKSL